MMTIEPAKYFNLSRNYGNELTASADVLAYATHNGILVVLYIVGAVEGIAAARAKLKMKERLDLSCGYTMKGSYGMSGTNFGFVHQTAETMRKDFALFLDPTVLGVMPGANFTYVMSPVDIKNPQDDPATVEAIGQRLNEILNVGILPEWYTEIVKQGRLDECMYKITCEGCLIWAVSTNRQMWTDVVSKLLKSNKISFPAAN